MRLGSVQEKDKNGTSVVLTAAPVARRPRTPALPILSRTENRTANGTVIRTRDNAWTIGDQAMNKCSFVTTSAMTRGCFL